MDSHSHSRLYLWSLAVVVALLAVAMFLARQLTLGPQNPEMLADSAEQETGPSQELVGEMDDGEESQLPTMNDLATDLWTPPPQAEADDGGYRLTDPDYVPRAMARGYLILPAPDARP
jgi:hypothetical protein